MFKSKTLFILGAGASCEAGLPAGFDLKKQIVDLIDIKFQDGFSRSSGDEDVYEALKEHVTGNGGRDVNYLLHKCWAMAKALPASAESIDNYLYNHAHDADVELIGKLGIAKAILNAERKSRLFDHKRAHERNGLFDATRLSDTWFMGLTQMLVNHLRRTEIERLFENVNFISFNYDRTIERFFPQIIGDHYGIPATDISALLVENAPIHPYGTVGELGPNTGVAYGASGGQRLLKISKGVRTFDEGCADESLLTRMRLLFSRAETIVFLGFAFHEQNLELLNPSGSCGASRIFATTMNISTPALKIIKRDLGRIIGRPVETSAASGHVDFTGLEDKASELLRISARSLLAAA